MSDLNVLSGLGVPGWVIILAALVFMLKQTGILDFVYQRVTSSAEFSRSQVEAASSAEQSEQVALWAQMTRLQTKTLDQNEFLLNHIIDNDAGWREKHNDQLAVALGNQREIIHQLRELSNKFGMVVELAGVKLNEH